MIFPSPGLSVSAPCSLHGPPPICWLPLPSSPLHRPPPLPRLVSSAGRWHFDRDIGLTRPSLVLLLPPLLSPDVQPGWGWEMQPPPPPSLSPTLHLQSLAFPLRERLGEELPALQVMWGGMLVGGGPPTLLQPPPLPSAPKRPIQKDALWGPPSCTPSMLCAGLRADGGQLSSPLYPRNTLILLIFSAFFPPPPPFPHPPRSVSIPSVGLMGNTWAASTGADTALHMGPLFPCSHMAPARGWQNVWVGSL